MKQKAGFIAIVGIMLTTAWNSVAQGPVRFRVVPPQEISAGDAFEIVANFSTAPDWFIYAATGRNEPHGMSETQMLFDLPEGLVLDGKPDMPVPKPKGMYEIWEGDKITIKQKLKGRRGIGGR